MTEKNTYLEDKFGLAGKTAVVTGGGGVLAGAIVKDFVLAGANVILWGRNQSTLDNKVEQLTKEALPAERLATVEIDLLQEDKIAAALKESVARFSKIDILVNGVGGSSKRCSFVDLDTTEYEDIVRQNLLAGCVLPSKQIAKYWIENNLPGNILNIASMGSFVPLSGGWAYSAAKAAVVNQTMAMAKELAPYNIRVNAVAPGFFLGKQNRKLLVNEDGTPTERGENILARTPIARFGNPEEVASACVFLASKAAAFITGVTLPVDGGYLCDNI
ncbi:MAG: SDR family oxidoreductase [Sedimentisphaerales bacterium]|nr:SDR family oxidoreductase [Sedimentisphaerales bacterium]